MIHAGQITAISSCYISPAIWIRTCSTLNLQSTVRIHRDASSQPMLAKLSYSI